MVQVGAETSSRSYRFAGTIPETQGSKFVSAALRWLGRTAGSLITALLLVGLGFYLYFLWSGPEPKPWHRLRFAAEFTAADYTAGRIRTLAQYRAGERRLLDQVRADMAGRLDAYDRTPYNRFNPGSLSDRLDHHAGQRGEVGLHILSDAGGG